MTPGDWEHVISQAAAIGVETAQLIGGEPLISPYFARLARYALDAGLKVNVFSNLVRVTPAQFDLLASPGVTVSTSWYAKCGKLHRMHDRLPFSAR